MFRANVVTPVFRPRGGGSSGAGLSLAFLAMMLLLLLLVVVVFLIVFLKRKKKEVKKKLKMREERLNELQTRLQESRENAYRAGEQLGIDAEDLAEELMGSSNLVCLVYPRGGVCDANFYDLKDGCCMLKSDNLRAQLEAERYEMVRNIAMEIGATVIAEIIVTDILPKFGARLASFSSKALAKIAAQGARMIAVRVALQTTAMIGKVLMKLGTGPVAVALFIFEMISLTMDMADLRNYDSFIENKSNMQMRDILIYKFNEQIKLNGGDYPMLFPYPLLFPDESEIIEEELMEHMMTEYLTEMLEVEGGEEFLTNMISQAFDMAESGIDEPAQTEEEEAGNLDTIDRWFKRVRRLHGLELDKYVFDALQADIPPARRDDIFLVPSMTSESTIGISITEEAAKRWNEEKREDWFKYLDPFFPPNRPEKDWVPPLAAVYTNKYMTPNMVNPGTVNSPNIVFDTLPRKVTIAYPFGPLFSTCEKPRTSAKYKEAIDPRQFGVKFDPQQGVCNYTRDYCDRYVIDYKRKNWKDDTPYTDCELTKDQEWAEVFLGTNVVRDAKRYYEDPAQFRVDVDRRYRQRWNENPVKAILLAPDVFGVYEAVEGFAESMQERMAGKDRYCLTGDTCKFFTAKHDGGNGMTWSARDKDGNLYPHPLLGAQAQVKHGEDHTFYVPEGGYFRVACDLGNEEEGKGNFTYDELPANGTKNFTCWNGKLNKDFKAADVADVVTEDIPREVSKIVYEEVAKPAVETILKKCPEGSSPYWFGWCRQNLHSFLPGPKLLGFGGKCDDRYVPANSELGRALVAAGISLRYRESGGSCHEPCLPGFNLASGAVGDAHCTKKK